MRNNIRTLRDQKRLSQVALAKAAGITRPYLSDIERGVRVPGTDIALRISRELGQPVERVFLESGAPFTPFPE